MPGAVALGWSGGKDSAMALARLREEARLEVARLLTTVTEGYDRVSMHGVRRTLLHRQAEAVGVPLLEVRIPPACPDEVYEERMGAAVRALLEEGVRRFAFGDLFLEDIRRYREAQLARAGAEPLFPLWGEPTAELARRFIRAGFRAVLVTVDPRKLPASFAGREFDEALLAELPPGVDPCGENGEFHTFVYDGPIFRHPLAVRRGEVVERDGFVFCDLVEADARPGQ